jgi:hypothetical protein
MGAVGLALSLVEVEDLRPAAAVTGMMLGNRPQRVAILYDVASMPCLRRDCRGLGQARGIGGKEEYPARLDKSGHLETAPVRLRSVLVEGVDLFPAPPVAEVTFGNRPEGIVAPRAGCLHDVALEPAGLLVDSGSCGGCRPRGALRARSRAMVGHGGLHRDFAQPSRYCGLDRLTGDGFGCGGRDCHTGWGRGRVARDGDCADAGDESYCGHDEPVRSELFNFSDERDTARDAVGDGRHRLHEYAQGEAEPGDKQDRKQQVDESCVSEPVPDDEHCGAGIAERLYDRDAQRGWSDQQCA